MSNDHIKLVNKGGKIVGVDPDTGDEVPIKLGSGLGSTNEPVPDTSYFEALSINEARLGPYTGNALGPQNNTLQSGKNSFSWDEIQWENKGAPIITGSSIGGSAGYPTLIHGPTVLGNPIDTWYCYWSSHNANDIGLATASDLWGPWTERGSVFSDPAGGQTASPSVLYDPLQDRLMLYYHVDDAGQYTKLATDTTLNDGTDWTIQTTVLDPPFDGTWFEQERTYLSVLRHGNGYVGVFQGRDDPKNAPGIGVMRSGDGINWSVEPTPAYDNTQWGKTNPRGFQGGSPRLSRLGGELTILYQDRGSQEIHALPFEERNSNFFPNPTTVLTKPSWSDADGIGPGETWRDGGYVFQFFYDDDVSNNDFNIGVVRAPQSEVI
jgi:hypothetical protein